MSRAFSRLDRGFASLGDSSEVLSWSARGFTSLSASKRGFLRLCRGFAPLGMLGEVSSLVTRGFAPLRGDEWGGCAVGW